jgi:hypothetical protein
MTRLRVQEIAKARGLSLSVLHAAINSKRTDKPVAMGTLRRYWYSTRDGKVIGEPIELVDIVLLGMIARVLGVPVSELVNEEELGQVRAGLLV